ncbi:hypothetical protein [Sphingobacterium griseoflavum]|uniref:Lipocalin-like domain-containing protein n=1 Tax=Sphingobacterium griseoflavum TaxID=1474952 RepID=A0ABQ3HSY1_9SPHI|nr:hypothetical protein [Sphingobacterium griseoflavum]GHE31216.1 hypothetical protein GCM10017764_12890 [Sphingobacterium griseoflavum]
MKRLLLLLVGTIAFVACKKDDNQQDLIYGRWYEFSQEYIERDLETGAVRVDRDTVEDSQDYLEFTTDGKVLSSVNRPGTFTHTNDSLFITVVYDNGSETLPLKYRISGDQLTITQSSTRQYEVLEQSLTYKKR